MLVGSNLKLNYTVVTNVEISVSTYQVEQMHKWTKNDSPVGNKGYSSLPKAYILQLPSDTTMWIDPVGNLASQSEHEQGHLQVNMIVTIVIIPRCSYREISRHC